MIRNEGKESFMTIYRLSISACTDCTPQYTQICNELQWIMAFANELLYRYKFAIKIRAQ